MMKIIDGKDYLPEVKELIRNIQDGEAGIYNQKQSYFFTIVFAVEGRGRGTKYIKK